MAYKFPDYPEILTNRHWQKNKGLFAKGTGETGVGEAMDAAFRVHDNIRVNAKKLNVFEMSPQGNAKTRTAVAEAFKGVLEYYKANVENDLRPKLQEIIKKAKAAASTWEKAKMVPKSSVKHAKAVEDAAERFMVALNKNSVVPLLNQDYEQCLKDIEVKEKILGQNVMRLKMYLEKVRTGCMKITTVAEFVGDFWDEDIRGVGTALPLVAKDLDLMAELKIWRTFASEGWKPKTDEEAVKKANQIEIVRKRIADAVAKLD